MKLDLGIVTGSLSQEAGGLYYSVRTPANMLTAHGHHVAVYGVLDDHFPEARSSWSVDALQCLPTRGPRRLSYAPQLIESLSAGHHDLLHVHGLWFYPSYAASVWGRRTRRPVVFSPRGTLDPWALRQSATTKRAMLALFAGRALREAAVLHALNEAEADSFRRFGLTNPIAIVPNGVDLPQRDDAVTAPTWHTEAGRKTLLFLGRIHPKKGSRAIIEAWHAAGRVRPSLFEDWRLVIAGWDDGGHLAELTGLVADLDLGEHVHFPGALYGEDKHRALCHASAFVLASHSEGLPMSVLEAWAYGLPVFMTEACNLTESFKANAAFEISTDPAAMANTLAQCLGDDAALRRAGAMGRQFVATHYQWSTVVDRMMELYGWVAGGGERPACVQS
ncbi:MAG: glycosyltransferase [Methylocystis silviterrae]|uniref:glycosyltransferase n=1 Tax=Methylocystis silviterrae TaxID=2743612 RepID=UPI003C79093D